MTIFFPSLTATFIHKVYISDYLQKNATEEDFNNHIDIADWLIRWRHAPDTMTLPADTPIQPIQQARLELVLNQLRQYWSEDFLRKLLLIQKELITLHQDSSKGNSFEGMTTLSRQLDPSLIQKVATWRLLFFPPLFGTAANVIQNQFTG